jgi:hypothetical protein
MPWRCPACHDPIRHNDYEARPRERERYRCHVCRLELMLDPDTDRLTVAPLAFASEMPDPNATEASNAPPRRRKGRGNRS